MAMRQPVTLQKQEDSENCWNGNNVRCIPYYNQTFQLGIVSDHCAALTDANDVMLTDGLVICSSIILLIGWLIHRNGHYVS